MKNIYAALFIASALTANAQLLNETFDSSSGFSVTDGNDASATFFSDGDGDYFGIFDGDSDGGENFGGNATPTDVKSYTGFDDNYLVNEDIDGEGGSLPFTLTWSGIVLSGETNLQISADFASTQADGPDYIKIAYRVDGGSWTEALGVAGQSGKFNTTVYEITDFASGFGDPSATALSIAATNLSNSFSLSGSESTLDIKAEFFNDNGSDNFAMDNLIVEALTGIQPPTGLTAEAAAAPNNKSQLEVSFTPDGSNNVLLVYNTEDSFGTPVDTTSYATGDSIPGGGTAAGVFSSSPAMITGLAPGTLYYIAAFSIDGSNNYSSSSSRFTGTTDTFALQLADFDGWVVEDVLNTSTWTVSGTSAMANGYEQFTPSDPAAPSESWLISPEFNFDATTDETFEFTYEVEFSDTITGLEVYYTDDYTGDPSNTSWTALTALNSELTDYVANGSGSVETEVNLSAISGTAVRLALKYESSNDGTETTRTWELTDPLISGNNASDPTITLGATPATVDEDATLGVTLTLPSNVSADTEFFLSSSDDGSELSFPSSVTVLSGTSSIGFDVNGLVDSTFDNDQTVLLTANREGYTPDTLEITVVDTDTPTASQDLVITQYYEGSVNNKYLELTNIGSSPLDLNGYTLVRWGNARAEEYKTATSEPSDNYDTLDLTPLGTLNAGQTVIIANSSAATPLAASSADLTQGFPGALTFNGNDSIVIYDTSTPNPAHIVDAIGFKPTPDEEDGGGFDTSFVRAAAIQGYDLSAGSNVTSSQFASVWTEVTTATVGGSSFGDDAFLGSSALVSLTAVSFTEASQTLAESDGSFDIDVTMTGLTSGSVVIDVTFDSGNSTADGSDITFTSPTQLTFSTNETQTVNVPIVDDGLDGSTEVASFTLSISSGTAVIGNDTHNVSIQDSDAVIADVFISEIADPDNGASDGRFIELFNASATEVDLGAGNWNLVYYANANTSGTDIALTGTIAAGGTYIIAQSANFSTAYPTATTDQTSGTINTNGDDNVELRFGGGQVGGTLVDVYGEPGAQALNSDARWFQDGRATRNADITSGNATFTISEWTINSDAGSNLNGIAELADMTPGVHPDPNVAAPTGVSATAVSASEISIEFTATDSNDVIIVFDTDDTFTVPTGDQPSVDDDFAGGTVLFIGQSSPYAHTALAENTQYYYSVFSVNGTEYSNTVQVNATTPIAGLINEEDFSGTPEWVNQSIAGTSGPAWNNNLGGKAAVDGFVGSPSTEIHYLVSPELDFSSVSGTVTVTLDYEGAANIADDGNPATDYEDSLKLVYSTAYSGSGDPEDPNTWTEVDFTFSNTNMMGPSGSLPDSAEIALPNSLNGENTVYLAFRYEAGGEVSNSEYWTIDNILITGSASSNPLGDYLDARVDADVSDLEVDVNGNGFTVLEEYLAGFGDGAGSDRIVFGVNAASNALTLTSDSASIPDGITVVLKVTNDLQVAPVVSGYTTSETGPDGNGDYTIEFIETYVEGVSPALTDQRFFFLEITAN